VSQNLLIIRSYFTALANASASACACASACASACACASAYPTSLVPVPADGGVLLDLAAPAPAPPAGLFGYIGFSNMFPRAPTTPPKSSQDTRKKPPPESIDLPPVFDVTPRWRHPGDRIALSDLDAQRRTEFMPIASGARDSLQDAAEKKRAAKREQRVNWLRMNTEMAETEIADDDTFDGIDRVLNAYSEVTTEYANLQGQLGFDSLDGTAAPASSNLPGPRQEFPPPLPDESDAGELEGNDSLTTMSYGSDSNSDLN
jgi:hypothetical protein